MNVQLDKTLKAISPEIPKFIRQQEKTYNKQATISIEKIDRPLILTRGEIQEMTDFMYSNPKGLLRELYNSLYYAIYDNRFTVIPTDKTVDFKKIGWGLDIVEFLEDRDLTKLKAIIHVDFFQSIDYEPLTVKFHWFKIQVATPKDSKSPKQLVQEETERREKLATIRQLRQELRQ